MLEDFLNTLYLRDNGAGWYSDYVKIYVGMSYVTDYTCTKHKTHDEMSEWLDEYNLKNCYITQWQAVAAHSCSIICVHCEHKRKQRAATFTI